MALHFEGWTQRQEFFLAEPLAASLTLYNHIQYRL